jgi:hypothetical protein
VVDVRQRLGRGDVVECDHALDLAADQPELVVAHAFHAGAIGVWPDDDDALGLGLLGAGTVHEGGHPADELAHALVA